MIEQIGRSGMYEKIARRMCLDPSLVMLWESPEPPPLPVMPLERLYFRVLPDFGLPQGDSGDLAFLARRCGYSNTAFEAGRQVRTVVTFYAVPDELVLLSLAPLCGHCALKVRNSETCYRRLCSRLDSGLADRGLLPDPANLETIRRIVMPCWDEAT